MSDTFENPYAAPAEMTEVEVIIDSTDDVLAGRSTRLAAAIVDGILLAAILLPIQFASGFISRTQLQQAGLAEQIGMSLAGVAVMLLLNGYLLVNRGQTIGKLLAKVQIVDFESGRLLPFVRVYIYRYLWTLPFVLLVLIIPGPIDDIFVNIVVMIDTLMIFGASRRCLHDLIAGSKVVLYKPDRQKLV